MSVPLCSRRCCTHTRGLTVAAEQLTWGLLEPGDRDSVAREVVETPLALNLGTSPCGPARCGMWEGGYVERMKRLTSCHLLLAHAGMPDASDDRASQARSAMTASGLEMPEGWSAEECPDWQS
jgi:hypothetical protein